MTGQKNITTKDFVAEYSDNEVRIRDLETYSEIIFKGSKIKDFKQVLDKIHWDLT